MLVLTTEHGGAVHQAVDPGSGRVVRLKMSLKLHKEDGDTPADTQSNSTDQNDDPDDVRTAESALHRSVDSYTCVCVLCKDSPLSAPFFSTSGTSVIISISPAGSSCGLLLQSQVRAAGGQRSV